ncbi:hypothetical protein PAMP_014478 [Pampus punctatissimus]
MEAKGQTVKKSRDAYQLLPPFDPVFSSHNLHDVITLHAMKTPCANNTGGERDARGHIKVCPLLSSPLMVNACVTLGIAHILEMRSPRERERGGGGEEEEKVEEEIRSNRFQFE